MKVVKQIAGCSVEVEAGGIKEIVKEFSDVSEVLYASQQCGACKGRNTRFQFRHSSGYDFYEVVCMNSKCRARLSLGQAKENKGLFPQRRNKDGSKKENFGWEIYQRDDDGSDHDNSHLDESHEESNGHAGDAPSDGSTNWRNMVVPFGGNQGKRLGDLSPEVILGYVEFYDGKPPTSPEAMLLNVACKTALKELQAAMVPGDDVPF